ncbi:uncharacterized protein LOC115770214 isoform X2 [Drosophila novamexicana]|uniref:uncharacterized protein LOC115770214 isoform X2 n=1 Tax=Drosophila novamexicana TaxID=47314 RepID=UPI0011E5C044|nr:uncharacterized protein LOC115770214 isoform X2 [Drosophila novamexicana]
MSVIINCAGYMALVYEASAAFLTMVQMVNLSKIMKFDMVDVMILFGGMCKIFCFGVLAVGIISRHRLMVKIWLLMAYAQIQWGDVGKMFYNMYEYVFTDKYKSKQEFMQEISDAYASLIGQVLARIGIILIVYRFFKSLEFPMKIKIVKVQLDQKAAELKAK